MKAIYAGSFDPFTNGHLDIVKQATDVFSIVYIVIANNSNKQRYYDEIKIQDIIDNILKDNDIKNACCITSNKLIADVAKIFGCTYLVRGLRNPNDYNYEENIAKINHEINPYLKTVYFRADNDVVSSSFVREMFSHGKDISRYVDTKIKNLMED